MVAALTHDRGGTNSMRNSCGAVTMPRIPRGSRLSGRLALKAPGPGRCSPGTGQLAPLHVKPANGILGRTPRESDDV